MQKQLMSKIGKMEKDQLIEVIESLCETKEVEKQLKLMLMPTKAEIDRAISKFARYSEYFISNSCSDRAYEKMIDAMNPIYSAIKYADNKLYAYIVYEVYQVAVDNDLYKIGCTEFIDDLMEDFRSIVENNDDLFSNKERIKYKSAIEECFGSDFSNYF